MTDIRRANLVVDRDTLVDRYRRHLNPHADERRFEWLYDQHPHGRPTVWLALEGAAGKVIGSGAIVPRRMIRGEESFVAYQMSDFWVDPEHRVLGPAVRLQKACIEGVASTGAPFYFDLPAPGMLAVYRRLRVDPQGSLARFAMPLRVDEQVAARVAWKPLAQSISTFANALLMLSHALRPRGDLTIVEQREDFDDEVDALARSVAAIDRNTYVERSAAYLNWRYRRHYSTSHRIATGRRNGDLKGYVAWIVKDAHAKVVDLFGGDASTISDLLGHAVGCARDERATSLSLSISANSKIRRILARAGFRQREEAPIILQAVRRGDPRADNDTFLHTLTHGDCDFDVG